MTISNNVDMVRTFYREQLETRVPFDTHPLKECTIKEKIGYCTMLAAIMQYEQQPLREQEIFLERIVKGIELDITAAQFLQDAQSIDESFAQQFYEQFLQEPIARNFLVDALVMIHAAEQVPEGQLVFVMELADIFGIHRDMFEDLIILVQKVLTSTPDLLINKEYKSIRFLDLLMNFNYLNSNPPEDLILIKNKSFSEEDIPYYNEFLSANNLVILKDCDFKNIKSSFFLGNIHTLILEGCIIEDCERLFTMKYVENIVLFNCEVKNIHIYRWCNFVGGLIAMANGVNFYSINCSFTNMELKINGYYEGNGLLCTGIKEVFFMNNKIEQCRINRKQTGSLYFVYFQSAQIPQNSNIWSINEKKFDTPILKKIDDYFVRDYKFNFDRQNNKLIRSSIKLYV